jgi:putative phage-type endonuclease
MLQQTQRSKDWYEIRKGKFTASRISELLGVKGLGKTGETYIFEMACEIALGINETEEKFVSRDTQRGIDLEPLAFRKFKELKEFDFLEVKPSYFFPYGKDAGASPDGLVGDDAVLEIKCPRAQKFFNLLKFGKEAIDSDYYDQMQMQMLCSNSVRCYFFNYIIFNGKEMWKEIIVERDEKRIELIKSRLDEAIKIRNEYVEYLLKENDF